MHYRAKKIRKRLFGIGVQSTNRLEEMLGLLAHEPDDVFWSVFNYCWSSCEDTWDLRGRVLGELRRRNRNGSPWREGWFASLPEQFPIYRGGSLWRANGLSWTFDPDVAASFARGHRGMAITDPVIASVTIKKSSRAILFATNNDNEMELLIDYGRFPPRKLTLAPVTELTTFTDDGHWVIAHRRSRGLDADPALKVGL